VPFSDISGQLNNCLHPSHLSLDNDIEVFLLHLWEHQEMDRSAIWNSGVIGDELSQRLIDVLCQERRVRGLNMSFSLGDEDLMDVLPLFGTA
jgi:hypothetical protein